MFGFKLTAQPLIHSILISLTLAQTLSMTPSAGLSLDQCSDGRSSINGTCKSKEDCIGGLHCLEGLCKCRPGTYQIMRNLGPFGQQPYCQPAPGYRSTCKTACQEPLVCEPDRRRPSSPIKMCQCPEGLLWEYGACFKKCPEGEFYSTRTRECKKNCQVGEIKINDSCLKEAELGETCEESAQCQPGFSHCLLGICSCVSGFFSNNKQCISEDLWCSEGRPPLDPGSGSPISCTKKASENDFDIQSIKPQDNLLRPSSNPMTPDDLRTVIDSCPTGLYCQTYSGSNSLPQSGHCCKRAEMKCPIGTPLENSTCSHPSSCPSDTHYCFNPDGATKTQAASLCCPKPCRGKDIYSEGRCYPHLSPGERCSLDEQCRQHRGSCVNETCQCSGESKAKSRGQNKYCEVSCTSEEFRYERTCIPRQKLGETCSGNFMCPLGAQCNQGKCQCRCGLKALSPTFCIEAPSCPSVEGGQITSIQRRPPNSPNPSRVLIPAESVIYCRTDAKPLQVQPAGNETVSSECPEEKYCSRIALNLGVCCPIPTPKCPNGQEPVSRKRCDLRDRKSCGDGNYCHLFFFTSSPSSGTICCPLSSNCESFFVYAEFLFQTVFLYVSRTREKRRIAILSLWRDGTLRKIPPGPPQEKITSSD